MGLDFRSFPNQHRASGQTLGSFTHWIFPALPTTLSLTMVALFLLGCVFLFFCGMMILQLIWGMFMFPETKSVPYEDIQKQLGITP